MGIGVEVDDLVPDALDVGPRRPAYDGRMRDVRALLALGLILVLCQACQEPKATAPTASEPAASSACGPVGTKCDPNGPKCICGPNEMCHGAVCSGGVWTAVEVFPESPAQ